VRFTLNKSSIIKSSREIRKIIKNGKIIKGYYFVFFIYKGNHKRVAFTVQKGIKKAIQRNLLKRKSRELWRIHSAGLAIEADIVILAKSTILEKTHKSVEFEFKKLLNKIK
jgi:ribonuclease P protein component